MRHTIDEAASLIGRTRRSIYRAMTEGRISYGLESDGRRYIDTAELLRVYGAFEPASQSVTVEMSHGVTVTGDLGEIIARAVAKAVAEAVEPLRQEIEKLRLDNAEQRLIEHNPEPQPEKAPTPGKPKLPGPAKSFSDLLAALAA